MDKVDKSMFKIQGSPDRKSALTIARFSREQTIDALFQFHTKDPAEIKNFNIVIDNSFASFSSSILQSLVELRISRGAACGCKYHIYVSNQGYKKLIDENREYIKFPHINAGGREYFLGMEIFVVNGIPCAAAKIALIAD